MVNLLATPRLGLHRLYWSPPNTVGYLLCHSAFIAIYKVILTAVNLGLRCIYDPEIFYLSIASAHLTNVGPISATH